MIDSILNAVTKHLGTNFGTSYHYYKENVEQKLTIPCFTVDVVSPLVRSKSPVLYDWTMPVVVHYFSDSKTEKKSDLYSVGGRTMECLEYLPFKGGLLRGEDISCQIVDDVLQIFITYKFTATTIVSNEETMESFVDTVIHTE